MKRRTFVAASPLVLLATAPVVRAQPNPGFEAAARYSAAKNGVSMLVMREGQVLFEDYPNAGAPDRAWETASGTQSFCGVLAAAAAADGLLAIDEACARTLVDWTDDRRAAITVRELLTLTSGLADPAMRRPWPRSRRSSLGSASSTAPRRSRSSVKSSGASWLQLAPNQTRWPISGNAFSTRPASPSGPGGAGPTACPCCRKALR